jgi:hypothetical protein
VSGRIRSIKPEWLEDERMALASAEARVLSIALLLLADDHGRGRASRTMLLGRVFPGKAPDTLAKALEELAGWFVRFYELDGQSYFEIKNWEKHQKVDKPGKPRVPAPSGPPENVREEGENVRASRGSSSPPDPGPDPERGAVEPPAPVRAPKRPDPMADALTGNDPASRADVRELHADWSAAFGRSGAKLRVGWGSDDAKILADCIDAHGLTDCKLVAKHAPNDGMVSGREDESKQKHESIRYIFGKEDAFSRILRDAKKAERKSGRSAIEKIEAAGDLR